jgi:hypothetical protein
MSIAGSRKFIDWVNSSHKLLSSCYTWGDSFVQLDGEVLPAKLSWNAGHRRSHCISHCKARANVVHAGSSVLNHVYMYLMLQLLLLPLTTYESFPGCSDTQHCN